MELRGNEFYVFNKVAFLLSYSDINNNNNKKL